MKRFLIQKMTGLAGAAVLVNLFLAAPVLAATAEEQIAQAVLPLPEDLRAGATVVSYDPTTGDRVVLRQGTNPVECEPMNPTDGFIRCYNKVMIPRHQFEAKLHAAKKTDKEVEEAVAAAIKAGTLKTPPYGTMSYRLAFKDGVIKKLWVMSVPFATSETIGVSTVSQRDAALKGQGLPWLMLAGTAGAHVMIPVAQ